MRGSFRYSTFPNAIMAAVRARRRVLPKFSKWTFPFLNAFIASISRGENPPSGPTSKVTGLTGVPSAVFSEQFSKSSLRSPSISQRIKSPDNP